MAGLSPPLPLNSPIQAWTLIGHAFLLLQAYVPNAEELKSDLVDNVWNSWLTNFTLSTDVFFTLSGCLCAFNFLRTVNKDHNMGEKEIYSAGYWLRFYKHRAVRLLPAYGFTILACK